ncbi:MAG: trypsin-like peptidase domain-containing protein [Thiobacillaceae bacterium]
MRGVRLLLLVFLTLVTAASQANAKANAKPDWASWVLKIEVDRLDGVKVLGSGVMIGPHQILTNCHVIRDASTIHASRDRKDVWLATRESGDEYLDLCVLKVPGYAGKFPRISKPADARVGIPVFAVGYSGGTFTVSEGNIKGLFTCDCGSGRVIQTSSYFDPGASGGGLFDTEGRLLGILTYKSKVGGNYHFAVPVAWMKQLGKVPLETISCKGSFWECAKRQNGYFLVACDQEARENWSDLLNLAIDWTSQEPDNPEAWMAWGRANLNLGHPDVAAKAFQKVLALEPTHAEARLELKNLKIDHGQAPSGVGD